MTKKKVIIIVGPTAVGKTALSIEIAHKFAGEVISGDSMQIYRHLDIGTAKIMPSETQGVRHHLIDICDINQRYTVYDFQQEANRLITAITHQQKLPLIVGGTGFYIKALVDNLNLGGDKERQDTTNIRQDYLQKLTQIGAKGLWQLLQQRDAVAAAQIAPQNTRRVIRALEVLDLTGQQFSQQQQHHANFDYLIIGLATERTLLYQRINQRVDEMLNRGLINEAHWLYEQRNQSPQASQGIGYKELFPYFAGEMSQIDAVELIKQNSRRFAKRQLTYFRHQLTIHWFDLIKYPQQLQQITALVEKFKE
ncbi:MAG: tRNA (adenosine(37)-N6)-dimethylallyltransferase MiaA [Lactobacillus sp.]|uniref:tRNA (adenosine(37)-N6)-dimethylallyltransferase MiaA n=1 Tax=Bombilactobacillus bombi TaxID=1303590 RepID=UPI0035EFBA34|nr:tRNA (adenosine(37)-N6)-dimethylallyltransferase MiaA [Lactobacillus sp.]